MLPIADQRSELGQIEDLIGRSVARRAAADVFAPQMHQINIDMKARKGRVLNWRDHPVCTQHFPRR